MDDVFFPVGGGDEIGASCYFLRIGGEKFLLDAGIRLNSEILFPVFEHLYAQGYIDGFWELAGIFLSHGHLDHIGALPKIVSENSEIAIYATSPTKAITELQLFDTLRIKEKTSLQTDFDIDLKLFNQALIESTVRAITEKEWYSPIELANSRITFFPAGHILGASMIYIETEIYNILYTGDFASFDQYTVPSYNIPDALDVDILITETTYGYQKVSSMNDIASERIYFASMIRKILEQGGIILIPAFAIGRSQEISLLFSELICQGLLPSVKIYIDGMSNAVCKLYESHGIKIFNQYVSEAPYNLLRNINSLTNSIIISSSGMLIDYSKSAKYAEIILQDNVNALFFTGYLDEESPGKRLFDLKEHIGSSFNINKKKIPINAFVDSYRLSAHTSHQGILELIKKVQPQKVIFVHGFPQYGSSVNVLREAYQEFSNTIELYQASNGVTVFL